MIWSKRLTVNHYGWGEGGFYLREGRPTHLIISNKGGSAATFQSGQFHNLYCQRNLLQKERLPHKVAVGYFAQFGKFGDGVLWWKHGLCPIPILILKNIHHCSGGRRCLNPLHRVKYPPNLSLSGWSTPSPLSLSLVRSAHQPTITSRSCTITLPANLLFLLNHQKMFQLQLDMNMAFLISRYKKRWQPKLFHCVSTA